jgi:hypothetical protein
LCFEFILIDHVECEKSEKFDIRFMNDREQVNNDGLGPTEEELERWNKNHECYHPLKEAFLIFEKWLVVISLVNTSKVKRDELYHLTFNT